MKRALIIAPHPDDEILGVGGTIARMVKENWEVTVLIVTTGFPPLFNETLVERGRQEMLQAHQFLGVSRTILLDEFPAAQLDTVPHSKLNAKLDEVMEEVKPELIFIPFMYDIHLDHQLVSLSALVAARPCLSHTPKTILAYETLSETFWNAPNGATAFIPNYYVDISQFLGSKIQAMEMYLSQLKAYPHQRSVEAIKALASFRGSTVGLEAAEAFVLIRQII
jgi:LmbE family N-acetylglucosaminyl deacetylase